MGQKYYLALHGQQAALVRKKGGEINVGHLRELAQDVKPLYIMKPILHGKRAKTVTGLGAKETLLRHLKLKLKSKKEILAALPFQVENLIPFSEDEMLILPSLFPRKEETDITLLASSKTVLKNHLLAWAPSNIDPDIVSCIPLGLLRFARHYLPEKESLFIFCSQGDLSTFVTVHKGKLAASQSLRKEDFQRVAASMQGKFPEITEILFIGSEPEQSPFTPIELKGETPLDFALPIGLALDAAAQDEQSAQFRVDPLLSKREVRKGKRQKFQYLALCTFLAAAAFVLGQHHLKKQEQDILRALGKEGSLKQVVAQLHQSVKIKKKTPYQLPTLPKVHEVLSWISQESSLDGEGTISRLSYKIANPPKLGSKTKTWAGRVDLEIKCDNPRSAHKFHQALLKEGSLIDQKKGVRWHEDHTIYRATFHLKQQRGRS